MSLNTHYLFFFPYAPKRVSFLKDKSELWCQMKNKKLPITKAAVCLRPMVPPSTAEKRGTKRQTRRGWSKRQSTSAVTCSYATRSATQHEIGWDIYREIRIPEGHNRMESLWSGHTLGAVTHSFQGFLILSVICKRRFNILCLCSCRWWRNIGHNAGYVVSLLT